MEEKKKASEAHMRATAKWEKENYDKVLVRFPKGTKEKITASGAKSVNSFIVEAVQEKSGKENNGRTGHQASGRDQRHPRHRGYAGPPAAALW